MMRAELFRKADGFEGLVGIQVGADPKRLAVSDVAYRADRRLGLGSTPPATYADPPDCDELVAEVSDLCVFGVPLDENLVEIAEKLADALVAPKHRRLASHRHHERRVPLDLGGECLQQAFDISPVVGVDRSAAGLHVLLRHRPRSIPPP